MKNRPLSTEKNEWRMAKGEGRIGRFMRLKIFKSQFAIRNFVRAIVIPLSVVPVRAFAQRTLTVNIGTDASLDTIISNVLTYMLIFIELLAIVLFVVGAFLFTISRGKEEGLASAGTGKSLMFNSMIGLAVVLSAHAILKTLLFLLYS